MSHAYIGGTLHRKSGILETHVAARDMAPGPFQDIREILAWVGDTYSEPFSGFHVSWERRGGSCYVQGDGVGGGWV